MALPPDIINEEEECKGKRSTESQKTRT